MKFAILSDLHYISRRRMLPGTSDDVLLRPAACETALRMAAAAADVILLTGDLTDEGDLWSHEDLLAILQDLQQQGKRVYVTTATHDFHHHRSYARCYNDTKAKFKSEPWNTPFFEPESADYRALVKDEFAWLDDASITPKLVRCASPGQLWELYAEFGPKHAFSVCAEAYSYCVELDDTTWCLMLNDNFRNIEARCNDSVTYPAVCLQWIRDLVKQAASQGKFIFACTHHPLIPPMPAYKIGATDRDMREPQVGHLLADLGISLVFSGHSHFADVGFMKSDAGKLLCDITTPSVWHYPPQFNIVDFDGQNTSIHIDSKILETVDGFDLGGKAFKDYIRSEFEKDYRQKIAKLPAPLNHIIPALQVKHLYPLCKRVCGLTKEEYEQIKLKYAFDIIMDLVHNMLGGDGSYTPDTPIYKFIMGLAAVLDSIVDIQPFINIKKDRLKGYSIREILEPMLFNNYIPDSNADFDFTKEPERKSDTPVFVSHAGMYLMTVLCILAIPFIKYTPLVAAVALPGLTLRKFRQEQKNPSHPERY